MIDCKITENYLKEKARMVKVDKDGLCTDCQNCPLNRRLNGADKYCGQLELLYPEKAIAIVQKWSDEHPQKTYKDDFFEKFPNAPKDANKTPKTCRANIYNISCSRSRIECSSRIGCDKCWNEVMSE